MSHSEQTWGLTNPVLDRLHAGEPAIGLGVQLARSAEVAFIAQHTGYDFIWIDSQHGLFDLETIRHLALACLPLGIAAVVRVRGVDDPFVGQLLDSGVTGIVFPNVDSAAEARAAVDRARFPPLGRRSLAGAYPQFGYQRVTPGTASAALESSTLIVCMIETTAGLENCEDIAGVEGVDVVHLGMSDMLNSMGRAGDHGGTEIMSALARVISAARSKGKFAGAGGTRDPIAQLEAVRRGVQFMTTHTDLGLVSEGAARRLESLRAQLRQTIGSSD